MDKKRLRVFVLLPSLEVGGAERQVLTLLSRWSQMVELRLMACRKGSLVQAAEASGVYSSLLSSNKYLFSMFLIPRIVIARLRSKESMVVEAFLPGMIILASIAKVLLGRRLTVIANRRSHLFYRDKGSFRAGFDKWSSSIVDLTICNSPSIADELIATGEVSANRILVIPNAFHIESRPITVESSLRPRIFVVSNHHAYKRVDDVLKALALTQKRGHLPDTYLFGSGQETERLKELSRMFGLRNVFFMGLSSDPWSLARQADIFIHASETEGFSNAVLEALGHGMSCIVSDIPPNRFVARDCAVYFPIGNVDLLAEHIERLLGSSSERSSHGICGLNLVEKEFGIDSVLERRVMAYQAVTS